MSHRLACLALLLLVSSPWVSRALAEDIAVGGGTVSVSPSPFSLSYNRKKLVAAASRGELERVSETQIVFRTSSGLTITVEGGDVLSVSVVSPKTASLSLRSPADETFGLQEYPVQGELSNKSVVGSSKRRGSGPPLMFASASAPILHTRSAWSVLFDDEDSVRFSYSPRKETIRAYATGRQLRARFAFGSPRERMQRINRLLPPLYLPPDWAYGVLYWRDDARRYLQGSENAQQRIVRDLDEILQRQLPISSYLIDRPYGTGSFGWGNFDFDRAHFPNINSLLSTLQQRNIKLVLWGANIASGKLGKQARAQKLLLRSKGSVHRAVNIMRPEGEALLAAGINKLPAEGWKIDRGDEGEIPAKIAAKHAALLPTLFQKKSGQENSFLFARNLSMQGRSSAALWNGDSWATFEGLRYSLVSGLRAGLIFFPFWGSDTGGYNGQPTDELFMRWLQVSSLSPFMEIKLDHAERTLWDGYSPEVYAELVRSTKRHEALRSYVKELMLESSETGMPIMRPLFLHFPEEDQAWLVHDQYLYGNELLVAPIVREGERVRSIYIPSGRWRAVCSGATFTGPRWIEQEVKLSEIPLFVSSDRLLAALQPGCS